MKRWTAELAAKGVAGVMIAADAAASPSAAELDPTPVPSSHPPAVSTSAVLARHSNNDSDRDSDRPTPLALPADLDAGRESTWKKLYINL